MITGWIIICIAIGIVVCLLAFNMSSNAATKEPKKNSLLPVIELKPCRYSKLVKSIYNKDLHSYNTFINSKNGKLYSVRNNTEYKRTKYSRNMELISEYRLLEFCTTELTYKTVIAFDYIGDLCEYTLLFNYSEDDFSVDDFVVSEKKPEEIYWKEFLEQMIKAEQERKLACKAFVKEAFDRYEAYTDLCIKYDSKPKEPITDVRVFARVCRLLGYNVSLDDYTINSYAKYEVLPYLKEYEDIYK